MVTIFTFSLHSGGDDCPARSRAVHFPAAEPVFAAVLDVFAGGGGVVDVAAVDHVGFAVWIVEDEGVGGQAD